MARASWSTTASLGQPLSAVPAHLVTPGSNVTTGVDLLGAGTALLIFIDYTVGEMHSRIVIDT